MEGEVQTSDDFIHILQAAIFEISNEISVKEEFISGFKVKKHKFWKIGTNIRFLLGFHLSTASESNIWVMGEFYQQPNFSEAVKRYRKIIWVTYREDFRSLSSEKLINSDMGWGCTIRVAQMMLLECLSRHSNCESWDLIWKIQENLENAPYSLHQIMEVSKLYGKEPGVWHSPSSIGYILTALLEKNPVSQLRSLFSMNSALYEDEVYSLACEVSREAALNMCKCLYEEYFDLGEHCSRCRKKILSYKWLNSLFIQVPVMLGIGYIINEYLETVRFLLTSPFTLGIIGGKPRMALYVLGFNEDGFVVLDPHFVQPAAQSSSEFKRLIRGYHASHIKVLDYSELEGSLSFGFLVKSENEWKALKKFILHENVKGIISVFEKETDGVLKSFENASADSSFLLV